MVQRLRNSCLFASIQDWRTLQKNLSVIGLAWMFLKDNKIVGHIGGGRTEVFINLDTKNKVVVCGEGNGGTFPVAIDLVS